MTGIGRRGRVPECRRMRLYAVALKGGAGGGGGGGGGGEGDRDRPWEGGLWVYGSWVVDG